VRHSQILPRLLANVRRLECYSYALPLHLARPITQLIGVAYMRLTHAAAGNVNDRSSDTRIAPGLRSQNAPERVEFPDFVNDVVAASIMK
jgi:hypothetical protein